MWSGLGTAHNIFFLYIFVKFCGFPVTNGIYKDSREFVARAEVEVGEYTADPDHVAFGVILKAEVIY